MTVAAKKGPRQSSAVGLLREGRVESRIVSRSHLQQSESVSTRFCLLLPILSVLLLVLVALFQRTSVQRGGGEAAGGAGKAGRDVGVECSRDSRTMKPTPPLDLLEVVRVLGLGQGRNRVGGVGWKGLEYMVGWVGRPRPDFCQENSCSAGD